MHIRGIVRHALQYMSLSQGESSSVFNEKDPAVESQVYPSEIDLTTYHEECAGRLVLDPKYVPSLLNIYFFSCLLSPCNREACIEFGDAVASRLKLSPDGTIVLWPQPSDDPEDPQNVWLSTPDQ